MSKAVSRLWVIPLAVVLMLAVGCEGIGETSIWASNKGNENMNIVIDGVNHGTLEPGGAKKVNVTAGVHTVEFKFTDGTAACSIAYPSVAQGTTYGISCSGTR